MSLSHQTDGQEGSVPATSTRYSEETQQRIIGLAAQLQAQYSGSLSASELATIVSEVGIEAPFVHKAIVQVGNVPSSATAVSYERRWHGFWSKTVTPWSWGNAASLMGALVLAYEENELGLALPFALGILLGPKRRGAWTGVAAISVEESVRVFYNSQSIYLPYHLHGIWYGVFGAALWTLGAGLRGMINLRKSSMAVSSGSVCVLPEDPEVLSK